MANPPSTDMKDVLESAGVGTFGTDIFIGKEPADPDNVVTIYATGGQNSNPKWSIDNPSLMVRVRNKSYPVGYSKAQEVKNALLGLSKQVINNTTYVGVWMQGDINRIGFDDNDRALFTLNFNINREPAAAGNRQEV